MSLGSRSFDPISPMMERGEILARREKFNTVIEEKPGFTATKSAETQTNQGIATLIDKNAVNITSFEVLYVMEA